MRFNLMERDYNTNQPSASPFRVSRHQCPSEDAKQQDHRRGAPGPRAAYHWSLRVWCGSHEGFEGKSPVWVLEHYPYALQPRPSSSSQVTTRPMLAIGNVLLDGGSMQLYAFAWDGKPSLQTAPRRGPNGHQAQSFLTHTRPVAYGAYRID